MDVTKGVSALRKDQTCLPQTLAHVFFSYIFLSSLYAFPSGSSDRIYTTRSRSDRVIYRRKSYNDYDEIGINLLPVSAEARVDHQKLN